MHPDSLKDFGAIQVLYLLTYLMNWKLHTCITIYYMWRTFYTIIKCSQRLFF